MSDSIPMVNDDQLDELRRIDETGAFLEDMLNEGFEQLENTLPLMETAVENYDLDTYRKKGHYLKGSMITLGLTYIAETCFDAQYLKEQSTRSATQDLMNEQLKELKRRRELTKTYLIEKKNLNISK